MLVSPCFWPTQGTNPSPAATSHISWFKVSVPESVNGLSGWGECSGETAGLFRRLAFEVWGSFRELKLLVFVCRGREVFLWDREYWGEGLQSTGPPLISLGLARRYSGFLYAGAAAVRAPAFPVVGRYTGGLWRGPLRWVWFESCLPLATP